MSSLKNKSIDTACCQATSSRPYAGRKSWFKHREAQTLLTKITTPRILMEVTRVIAYLIMLVVGGSFSRFLLISCL